MLQTAPENRILHLSLELSNQKWLLGLTDGRPQIHKPEIKARQLDALRTEIAAAKRKFKLPPDCRVVSCYEAGRDGFWLHRWLLSQGVENRVVDSASIEQSRRKRRAKSDRVDVEKLAQLSIRVAGGETTAWHVVNVPAAAVEDVRGLSREAGELTNDITMHCNRIKGQLAAQGIVCSIGGGFPERLPKLCMPCGGRLGSILQEHLKREWTRMMDAARLLKEVNARQRDLMRQAQSKPEEIKKTFGPQVLACLEKANRLRQLRGIDLLAFALVLEFFGWREFKNARQVGGLSGLTGTPFNSGNSTHEQGISKAGNKRVRTMAVELSWCWLMYQKNSGLSQWYMRRFGRGDRRMRKKGSIALARKLLVAWWRFLDQGVVPEGATLKK
jgi:transposase